VATTQESTLIPNIVEFLARYFGSIVFVRADSVNRALAMAKKLHLSAEDIPVKFNVENLPADDDPIGGFERALEGQSFRKWNTVIIFGANPLTLTDAALEIWWKFNAATGSPDNLPFDRAAYVPDFDQAMVLGIRPELGGLDLELR
jgi:hypothetical protein